jgi:hypothetical protein
VWGLHFVTDGRMIMDIMMMMMFIDRGVLKLTWDPNHGGCSIFPE